MNASKKFHVRRGDTVKIISGNEKGKTGKILSMDTQKGRAIVEGMNLITKHLKPSASNPNGEIVKREASIHLSNLMLVNPANGEATRVGRKLNAEGALQRYSKKTGEFINNG